jgi:nucleoside-diphosphate-sugar epimerase
MNVFITGGAGFIGSHLAERCLREQWKVSVLDNLSTGSMSNIASLRSNPKFHCRIGNIFDAELVAELVDECDLVVHLAAAVGVRLIVESPVRTIETNVHGTEVVLRAAAQKRKRVLLASTSEVYGMTAQFPCQEDADLVLGASTIGRWSYACSKLLDEFLGIAYWREKHVPVNVVRLFNTIGPRQTGQYGMVVPTLVGQAFSGEPLTVFGTGEQTRCFGYVGDVVEALVRLAERSDIVGEVINIGNDEEISIVELARMIKEMTGSASEIRYVPYEEAYGPGFEDTARRVPSVAKLEKLLGYRPTTPLREALALVAQDIRPDFRYTPVVSATS